MTTLSCGFCTYELTGVVTLRTKPVQAQDLSNYSIVKGDAYKVPPISKRNLQLLLAGRGRVSFLQEYSTH